MFVKTDHCKQIIQLTSATAFYIDQRTLINFQTTRQVNEALYTALFNYDDNFIHDATTMRTRRYDKYDDKYDDGVNNDENAMVQS